MGKRMGRTVGKRSFPGQILNGFLTIPDVRQSMTEAGLLKGNAQQDEIILGIFGDQDISG